MKLIAYFLVTALAAASFCVGLNQETSAQNNFAAAEESFTTVAVPTLYADSTPTLRRTGICIMRSSRKSFRS